MASKTRVSARSTAKPPRSDGDGNHIHNEVLLGLPRRECEALFSKLEFVRLRTHHVLHEPGDSLKSARDWSSLYSGAHFQAACCFGSVWPCMGVRCATLALESCGISV